MDSLYGAYLDWDLYSYGAVFTSLLGGFAWTRFARAGDARGAAALLLGLALATACVHLSARLHAMDVEHERHVEEHEIGSVALRQTKTFLAAGGADDVESGVLELELQDSSDRRLVVQFWYPAVPDDDALAEPWLSQLDVVGPSIASAFGFPSFALGHADLIKSHSYSQAAVAGVEPFPVVLYSHGWTGLRTNGLDQIEALVSHGFIVVAADHTYGAAATAFPDGELVVYEPTALPEFGTVPDEEYDEAAVLLVATYAADLHFILDELQRLNGDPGWLLSGRLDLDRIGVFGHSTGGGAAVSACATDGRCDAVAGLDPWVEPVPQEILDGGIDIPFLAIRSAEWFEYDNDPVLQAFAGRSLRTDLLGLIGGGHQDFTVLPRFSAVSALLDVKGSIGSDRASEIVNTYLVRFFDAQLNGGPDLSSDPLFEEVCVGLCEIPDG